MKKERIVEILDTYGLEFILEDNQITVVEVLDILEELGFIDLEEYNNDPT